MGVIVVIFILLVGCTILGCMLERRDKIRQTQGGFSKNQVGNIDGTSVGDPSKSTTQRIAIPSDQMITQILTQRFIQLRLAIERYFLERGIQYEFIDIDDVDNDDNIETIRDSGWFDLTLVCRINNNNIYVTLRGHISRLHSKDPRRVAGWIEDDLPGMHTTMSNYDDIIAYYSETPRNIIDQILRVCNSAAM